MRWPLVIVLACALGCEEKSKKPVPLSQQAPAAENAALKPVAPPPAPEQPKPEKPKPALAVNPSQANSGIAATNRLGFSIPRGAALQQLQFDGSGAITEGEGTVRLSGESGGGPVGAVDRLAPPEGKLVVLVDLSMDPKRSLLGQSVRSAQMVEAPMLFDAGGAIYECFGFVENDGDQATVRYTPDRALRGLSEVPGLSASRLQAGIKLVFIVEPGAQIQRMQIGPKVLVEFDPPVKCDGKQR